MDKLGIKATIYDIFGYAIPGGVLLTAFYVLSIDVSKLDIGQLMKVEISWPFGGAVFVAFYIFGHLLSSVSSFVFENELMNKISSFVFGYGLNASKYDEAAEKKLGKKYDECGQRAIIVYCQNNHPAIYETAFTFLSIYGLSRNVAMAMILIFPLFLDKHFPPVWNIIYIASFVFMARHYFRFKDYFLHQIASSLIVPAKTP
jgi:hypothetical protein